MFKNALLLLTFILFVFSSGAEAQRVFDYNNSSYKPLLENANHYNYAPAKVAFFRALAVVAPEYVGVYYGDSAQLSPEMAAELEAIYWEFVRHYNYTDPWSAAWADTEKGRHTYYSQGLPPRFERAQEAGYHTYW